MRERRYARVLEAARERQRCVAAVAALERTKDH